MREHERLAEEAALEIGASFRWQNGGKHQKLFVSKNGRSRMFVVSYSPRNRGSTGRLIAQQIKREFKNQ